MISTSNLKGPQRPYGLRTFRAGMMISWNFRSPRCRSWRRKELVIRPKETTNEHHRVLPRRRRWRYSSNKVAQCTQTFFHSSGEAFLRGFKHTLPLSSVSRIISNDVWTETDICVLVGDRGADHRGRYFPPRKSRSSGSDSGHMHVGIA